MEAQEDGVMGKIIVQAGAQKIPVGQVIAVLAEEGDDLSSITIPETPPAPEQPKQQEAKEEQKSAEQKSSEQKSSEQKAREQPRDERKHREHKEIKHPKPLFPSVSRLYVPRPFPLADSAHYSRNLFYVDCKNRPCRATRSPS